MRHARFHAPALSSAPQVRLSTPNPAKAAAPSAAATAAAVNGAAARCNASASTTSTASSSLPPLPGGEQHPTSSPTPARRAPWQLSSYFTNNQTRHTDSLGNVLGSLDTLADPPGWTPDSQLRLAAEALAPSLQQDADSLVHQVQQLPHLLPGMQGALRLMKPAELVRMAAELESILRQLVDLRVRFPQADVAAMVAAYPPLLRMSTDQLEAAVAAVRAAFPGASEDDLEGMLARNAALLDGGEILQRCLAGVGHLMSKPQILLTLQRDPTFLFQFESLEGVSAGERDAEYLSDMYRCR
ncbi:hypothetical protein D9Q98_009260 [Chlorella vulgaris]|uniref:Uncharacterized protein n=1 Tax=Chlorella vulgaris TaxID=3077 RepID=A0A9D4TP90_CHLVU|nr:hypothetical protein D9Q98_009260 [Chlorella vulgaris]